MLLLTSCGAVNNRKCYAFGEDCHPGEEPDVVERVGTPGTTGSQGPRGVTGSSGPSGRSGTSCTVVQDLQSKTLSCTDGTEVVIHDGINGEDGEQGIPGTPGADGRSIVFSLTDAGELCETSGTIFMVAYDDNDNAVLDVLEDSGLASATVCSGSDGEDAPPTEFTPVGLIDPCGDAPAIYDEVLLQLSGGAVMASFSDTMGGDNTRLSVLPPGNYITSDGSACPFSFDGVDVTW